MKKNNKTQKTAAVMAAIVGMAVVAGPAISAIHAQTEETGQVLQDTQSVNPKPQEDIPSTTVDDESFDDLTTEGDSFITSSGLFANIPSNAAPTGAVTPLATGDITIDATTFPDANFRNWIVAQTYGQDNVLTPAEIATVTVMDVSNQTIVDLTGIEYFTALTNLNCSRNQSITLDLSKNTALTTLNCSGNTLTQLDISKNIALTNLNCFANRLTQLDISKNTALTTLDCSSNQLTSLDTSNNTALTTLEVYFNKLTTLDVSKSTELTKLKINHNELTALDVTNNIKLRDFECYNNKLTALDVSLNTALTKLRCDNNQLTSLDVTNNTKLTNLTLENNQLTTLDVTPNTALTSLDVTSNQLETLDLSKNTALSLLLCNKNQLKELDVSLNTRLSTLRCSNNKLICLILPNPDIITSSEFTPQIVNSIPQGNSFDLTKFAPSIDGSKITGISGATLTGTTLSNLTAQEVTYTYQANDNKSLAVTLKVKQANNWTTPLSIGSWKYGETPKAPTAVALHGTPTFVYSNAETGTYTDVVPTNAGTWYVKAIVAETDAYVGLESDPVSFNITKGTPTVTEPTGLTATYGQTLANVTLGNGWLWDDDSTAVTVNNSGYAAHLPVDDANYDYTGIAGYDQASKSVKRTLAVTVAKAPAPTVTEPTGLTATYGQTLADVTLGNGWVWENDGTAVTVNNSGYAAKLPVDDVNYDYTSVSGYDATSKSVKRTLAVTVAKAPAPTVTEPTGLTATFGQTLADIKLPNGWKWVEPTTAVTVNNSGYAVRLAVDDENYDYTGVDGYVGTPSTFSAAPTSHYVERKITVAVAKAPAPAITEPTDLVTMTDNTLAQVTLPDGWSWADNTQVVATGTNGYVARLTVDDTNYDYTGVAGYNAVGHYVERTIMVEGILTTGDGDNPTDPDGGGSDDGTGNDPDNGSGDNSGNGSGDGSDNGSGGGSTGTGDNDQDINGNNTDQNATNNAQTGDATASIAGGLSIAAILSACTAWFISKRKKKANER